MSIYISTVTSGHPSAHYVMSLLRMERRLTQLEAEGSLRHLFEMSAGISPIQVARNLQVARFLSFPEATHLLFVDDDQVFEPDYVLALLEARKPIVGALIPQKVDAPRYAAVAKRDPKRDGDCVEVQSVGMGFTMVERSVFTLLQECGYRHVFDCEEDPATGRYVGEDYTFCSRARRLGFESWVHAGLNVGHVGEKIFRPFHGADDRARLLMGEDVGSGTA